MQDTFVRNDLHLLVLPSVDQRSVDLTWRRNPVTNAVGYNVWRAVANPTDWVKITTEPVNVTFFRDCSKIEQAIETPIWESGTDSATGVFILKVKKTPMCAMTLGDASIVQLANAADVQVLSKKTGKKLNVDLVNPVRGLIQLTRKLVVAESVDFLEKPPFEEDAQNLEVTYYWVSRLTDSAFGRDLYYKVTEVLGDGSETPLDQAAYVSNQDLEKLDYYWREAIRKNRFIIEQSGEPAFLLMAKTTGRICDCVDTETLKSRNNCPVCWGVGYVGGYDGPYKIMFTPPNAPSQTRQGQEGKSKIRVAQSILGPTPTLMPGDIIVRFNGEKLVVTEVERTQVGGVTLQQQYNTELLKVSDFRQRLNVRNPNFPWQLVVSSDQPLRSYDSTPPIDDLKSGISLEEGLISTEVSDPTLDSTKSPYPEDLRTNTDASNTPRWENWNL
jgi:hypothetical protein